METLYEDQYTNQLLEFIIEGLENDDNFDKIVDDADKIFKIVDKSSSENDNDIFHFKLTDDSDNKKTIKIKTKDNDTEDNSSDTNTKDIDDSIDQEVSDVYERENPSTKKSKSFKVNVVKDDDEDEKVKIKFKLKDKDKEGIHIKLLDKDEDPNVIKFKLEKPGKKKINQMNLKIRPETEAEKLEKTRQDLVNRLASNEELKDILTNDNASSILGTCLQILKSTKTTLEKLTILLPDDSTLLKTNHVIGQLINRILDNQEEISDNLDQCKELAIQIVKMTMDLKAYLKVKAKDIEASINNSDNRDPDVDEELDKAKPEIEKVNRDTKAGKKDEPAVNEKVPSQKMSETPN